MIVSIQKFRQHVQTAIEDPQLEAMLQAVESLIRKYTNNNFQNRKIRFVAAPTAEGITVTSPYLNEGDTVQITQSNYNDGLYSVEKNTDGALIIPTKYEETAALVTKVEYPEDVQMGAINMVKWDLESRDKIGIASETISRHSVAYFNMDEANTRLSYPTAIVGFLKPYIKARF